MHAEPTSPATAEQIEKRRKQLRMFIDALTGSVVDHKAAGRFDCARTEQRMVAGYRAELARLGGAYPLITNDGAADLGLDLGRS